MVLIDTVWVLFFSNVIIYYICIVFILACFSMIVSYLWTSEVKIQRK